ncbi:MAG: hypothetical protein AAGD28_03245, partial [Bacteroidota bacterium]
MKSLMTIGLLALLCLNKSYAQNPNDLCSNAIATDSIENQQSIVIAFSNTSQSLIASCEDSTDTNLDLWYSFTMPFDGQIRLTGLSTVNKTSLYESCGGQELTCMAGNGFMTGLTGGTTYLLRYGTASQFSGNNTLFIQAFPPPSNDECVAAISIPDISIKQNIQVDNRGASETVELGCDPANQDNLDIWYQFDMPYDGHVKVSGSSGSHKLALFDACGGNEISCFSSTGFFLNLNANQTYLLRFASNSSSAGTSNLSIQAFAPPPNDSCSGAISLGDLSTPINLDLDNRGANESLNASCESARFEYLDLWYEFEMPFDGNVKITGVFGVNRLTLFDGCGGNELACNTGLSFWQGLDSGQVYLMRYSSLRSQAINDQINILAAPTAPNDECTNATFIDSLELGITLSLDTRSATESLDASCESASEDNLDLWYEFVMPFFGNIKINGVFGVNRLALFDACGGNELECSQSGAFFENLTAGQRYLLRYAAISQQSNFDQINIQAVPTGLNDECIDAFLIPDIDQEQIISLDTRAASESLDSSCETDTDENLDLWYRFSMPFDGLLKASGVFGVNKLALFDSCGGSEIACFGSNGVFYNLDSGQVYFLRYAATRQMANVDDFKVQAFSNLAHDLCENAVEIERPDSAQYIVADTREASQSLISSCEDSTFSQQDLWYRFMMPFDGKLFIREGNNAHNFSLWDSCGGNEITCFSGFGEFEGLEDSTEYWLRYASPFGNATLDSFEVEAVMSVGIGEIEESPFKVYPNPAKDFVVVEWEGEVTEEISISIYDMSARKLLSRRLGVPSLSSQKWEFKITDLPQG